MRVTLLGTGTAIPNGDRYQSGALVESSDRSRRLLVDCGSGVVHRLAEAGVSPDEVDAVVLTHTHLDHVADLASLVKARVLAGEQALTVHGPRRTVETLDYLLAVDDLHERASVTVREADAGTFEAAGFSVTAREADHSTPTLGYRVEDASADAEAGRSSRAETDAEAGRDAETEKNAETAREAETGEDAATKTDADTRGDTDTRTNANEEAESEGGAGAESSAGGGSDGYDAAVTFSGDTVASTAIADLADGSAVLVHDCTHPDSGADNDGADGDDHATPSELAGVLAGREIGTVYLTHLAPDTRGKEGAMTATIEKRFPGEVRIANDLTTFDVGDGR